MGCADLLNAVQCLGSGDLADGEQAGSRARLAAVPGGVTSGGQPGGGHLGGVSHLGANQGGPLRGGHLGSERGGH